MDPIGLVDDGSDFDHDNAIHFPRLPAGKASEVVDLPNVFLMHLQYADWARMSSKRRWYITWERINYPTKAALRIIRRYSHMDVIHKSQTAKVPENWLAEYELHGVKLGRLQNHQDGYRWDPLVKQWIENGQVKDWHLLLSEIDIKALGLEIDSKMLREVSRQQGYLRLTAPIYSARRFLFWRIVLRVLDELTSRIVLR